MSERTSRETPPSEPARFEPFELHDEDDQAALVALAGLPRLAPSRLWSLLRLGRPSEVWQRVRSGGAPRHGRTPDAADRWPAWAQRIDPMRELDRHRQAGVAVLVYGHADYPDALLDDPDPPAVLFRQGPGLNDDRARVAVVGTRACTGYGRDVATELGRALAGRGVDVVSGLASGIDAAAHAGTMQSDPARVVAVVAGGVDVIYPPQNRGLYAAAATHGALVSEWPLGSRPEQWRFPARNRIVAALTAAVVVIESAEKGGSLYTVDEALERNRAVFAVPGSIYSPASAGTNRLIADGAHPLHVFDELLDAVAPVETAKQGVLIPQRARPDSWLLDLIGWQPAVLDTIVSDSGRSPSDVTLEVERLIGAGVVRRAGGIVEQIA